MFAFRPLVRDYTKRFLKTVYNFRSCAAVSSALGLQEHVRSGMELQPCWAGLASAQQCKGLEMSKKNVNGL